MTSNRRHKVVSARLCAGGSGERRVRTPRERRPSVSPTTTPQVCTLARIRAHEHSGCCGGSYSPVVFYQCVTGNLVICRCVISTCIEKWRHQDGAVRSSNRQAASTLDVGRFRRLGGSEAGGRKAAERAAPEDPLGESPRARAVYWAARTLCPWLHLRGFSGSLSLNWTGSQCSARMPPLRALTAGSGWAQLAAEPCLSQTPAARAAWQARKVAGYG